MSGVRIKTSRFNHSCLPNAATGKIIVKPNLVFKFKLNIICNILNFKTQKNIDRQ